ncbi:MULTISPECIES: HNH endonuclease [unclassified Sphingobium]|uniref:HNH endonuclease n=1 Tax=unclassified Sphingobium TaxID=2611147 RepID=UPI002224F145|nr:MULTISPECIES: HNH endonuclease signature motif containing protein [unclassified Sphingobium]MCW2411366.1 hypothetical protein [Sphingobium sp. B8D3D]MCW2416342.1 hypothetical protein [Sphingobium sp. B8D3A]
MMKLPLPDIDHAVVYEAARARFADKNLKQRLSDGQAAVMALGNDFIALGNDGQLHTIAPDPAVPPAIQPGDMQRLYTSGLLRKKSDARNYYDRLRLSSPFRVCPFCLHRPVRSLDHYLPKAQYGAYAVLPANLVPSCRDCNSDKDIFAPETRSSSIIHPYFDHIDDEPWLGCEINNLDGFCTATFFISSAAISEDLRPRLISHMEALNLFDLYDVEGARELNEMAAALKKTFDTSGATGVQSLCETIADSRSALANNYWRSVLWRAAANNEQFRSLEWYHAA